MFVELWEEFTIASPESLVSQNAIYTNTGMLAGQVIVPSVGV